MQITKYDVIYKAGEQIKQLEKEFRIAVKIVNYYKPLIQANDEKNVKYLATIYNRTYPQYPLSTDIEKAQRLITIYQHNKTRCEQSIKETRILVEQLKRDEKTLLKELEELNNKLDLCSHNGYQYEICKRLSILITKFLMTEQELCKKHLSICKKVFPKIT